MFYLEAIRDFNSIIVVKRQILQVAAPVIKL